jgi:predicted permease
MRAREFEESGLSPEAARRAAEEAFGDVPRLVAECRTERRRRRRAERRHALVHGLAGDARYAVRALRRNPWFTTAALATLGLGIGIAIAMAALLDAYLVRGLPYPSADRLVTVEGPGAPDWRTPPPIFGDVVAWDLDALSIVGGARPERVWSSWVTPGFFTALGVRPALGRLFTAEEAAGAGGSVAVISHDLWRRRWAGDPSVLGRTFTAYSDDRPDEAELFTIVGVLPETFWYPNRFTEVLAPLRSERLVSMATLAPGVSAAEAESVLRRAAQASDPARADVRVTRMRDAYVASVRPTLWAIAGAVALVLAIACGNAGVLVLVRAAGREQEFAVRGAIGAGRSRIARQLMVEGVLLAGGAAALGLALGAWLLAVLRGPLPALLGTAVPGGAAALRLNATSVLAALVIAGAAGMIFGLLPLASALRGRGATALGSAQRGTDTARRQRLRAGLVVTEIALSLAILVGAGLLVRSALHLRTLELGFDPDDVVAVELSLPQRKYDGPAARRAFYERALREVEAALPDAPAAFISWAPFSRLGASAVETPDAPAVVGDGREAFVQLVTPSYFETLGIALRRGATFDATHTFASEPVALVSESLARRLWPDQDPIGRTVRAAPQNADPAAEPPPWRRVVGVVADVRKTLAPTNPPDLYVPMAQSPPILAELVVRDRAAVPRLDALRAAVWRVDADLPLNGVRRLDDAIALASLPSRFLAWLLSAFAAFAVTLATLGLYGVVAFAVGERRREIAVRMALGARPAAVVGMFVRQAGRLIAAGTAAGLLGGLALSRALRAQLHGVSSGDVATYVILAAALAVAALLATWLPARRATRAQPMRILGGE